LPDQLLTMALPSSTADGPAREWRALERHRRQPALTSGRMVCGTGGTGQPGGCPEPGDPNRPSRRRLAWASGGAAGRAPISSHTRRHGNQVLQKRRQARC
jgi:hypothetical protein